MSSKFANLSLHHSFRAAKILIDACRDQLIASRLKRYREIPTLLGCYVGKTDPDLAQSIGYADAFNAVDLPLSWRLLEPTQGEYEWDLADRWVDWCVSNKLAIRGGPLLDLAPHGFPTWIRGWEHELANLHCLFSDFVETVLRRYLGKVRIWEISASANSGGGLSLSEEHRLEIAARTLEIARSVDEESLLFIRVDQPWGEYQARGQHRLSPLQFTDAIVRSGLGLSGINIEIATGFQPRGEITRDTLDVSRLIDQWSQLGLPLQVTLACPSGSGPDPNCFSDVEVDAAELTPATQASWIEEYVPMLISKPQVTGIFWTNLADASPHEFPHAGLIDSSGVPKPGLGKMASFRNAYLK